MRLIGLVLLAQSLLLAPLAAHAQQAGKVYRIGHLAPADFDRPDPMEQRAWPAFVDGLKSLGWIEGKNFVFERRMSSTRTGIQQAAGEFVRKKVDVIVLVGGARAAMVQQVTRTIPTVLRRYSWHPGILAIYREATDDAAQKLGIKVRYVHFENADELPGVFAEMRRERDGAVLIWEDTAIDEVAPQLLDLAVKHRLPTIVDSAKWAKTGALIGYGPKANDLFRQAAGHVDRILRGAKPGDLPIGQPTTFELICNARTAKALGLTIPESILLLADQVVE